VPNALDFAKTDADRKVIEPYLTQKQVARPIIAPPGGTAGGAAHRLRGARPRP
jgi:hypothetical protein